MPVLTASVGKAGKNRELDVRVVQLLLTQAGVFAGAEDGICRRTTMEAIERFQHGFMPHPTGFMDPDSDTWTRLQAVPAPSITNPVVASHTMQAMRTESAHMAALATTSPVLAPAFRAAAGALAAAGDARTYWTGLSRMTAPADVNAGLVCPTSAEMIAMLGKPGSKTADAQLSTVAVGPFSAFGLTPAMNSMAAVFAKVHVELPDLYDLIELDGLYNARMIRGSTTNWSNHSWGAAVDLKIGSSLVAWKAQYSMRGLDALATYFNAAGWYWGGGYKNGARNDPMHYECGTALLHSFGL